MRVIFKFPLLTGSYLSLQMPKGAKVLCIQTQGRHNVCIWAECDSTQGMEERKFFLYATGEPMSELSQTYVGTFQLDEGGLVFHVYEVNSL